MSERQIYDLECVLIALFAGAFALRFLVLRLRRQQVDLDIGKAIAVGFGLRVIAALVVSGTSFASQLRGGDEIKWLNDAGSLARWDLVSTGTWEGLSTAFHSFFFSLNFRVFEIVPDMMLRVEVITVAMGGITLLAAAVYELAGRRAALITAWVLALEPSNIFFSGLLHKEPFMLFAEGLVAYAGARLWKRGDFRALIPMTIACLMATATRPYVGWFLSMGAAAIALHAGLRARSAAASFGLVTIVLALGVAFVPAVWDASSTENLAELQASQDANASDDEANLSLERVDYSTRENIIFNLPTRVADIATKPYPWQLGNVSQQLGLLGTTAMTLGLLALMATLLQNGSAVMRRAGPLIYPALFLLVAYSLSAGNAGTAFRYRTHLVAFLLAVVCTLRETRTTSRAATPVRSGAGMRPAYPQRQAT